MNAQGTITPVGERARRNTISDAFRRSARRNGPLAALSFAGRRWTYAELDRAVNRVAARLVAMGLEKGDRVAAYGRNSDAYLILWLASCRAGTVHVPVNYALTGRELTYILRQSGAKAVFHDTGLAATVAGGVWGVSVGISGTIQSGEGTDILAFAHDEAAPGDDFDVDVTDTDLAQFLYTSGTTADPKGAMMTHRALLSEYMACAVDLEMSYRDKSLDALPLYHAAQMHVFLMPHLMIGAESILIEAPAPDICLRLIEEHAITSFFAPPTVWIGLLRHPDFDRRDLSSLKNVYYGASIMPVPVLQELRRRLPGARPFNCYGQSEIAPMATLLRPEEHEARPASAGRPIGTVETRVVDTAMNDCPPNVRGEIVHRSPQLLIGYWDKPDATAEAFEGGWFHSGDVGYLDEEGYLYVVDRVKDIIKTGGSMVASREVEEALFTHAAVAEVAVVALPDPKWIEAVTAVVVLKQGAVATEAELVEHAKSSLAPFKVPKKIIFRPDLPRNTAGKILKRELRDEYAEAG
jgi:fatty-acyl-CoA synthase